MKEFWIFIADQKSDKYITYNKIRQANLVQVLVERRMSTEKSKIHIFFLFKTFVKKKNIIVYKPATLMYFQLSNQRHLNSKGSTMNLQKEYCFKLLNFFERS